MPYDFGSFSFTSSLSQYQLFLGLSFATGVVVGAFTHRYFPRNPSSSVHCARHSNHSLSTTSQLIKDSNSPSSSSPKTHEGEHIFSTRKPQKMVFIVRTDLNMGKGKIAAQCCHACLAVYEQAITMNPKAVRAWKLQGQTKIALKCDSEEEMLELESKAISFGLPAESILDAGRTQIQAGTRTVLAIGPAPVEMVDQVTGHLKLM